MQYIHLGRSGLKVSRLCLGTMNFGPETSEADSFLIMDRALELGINFFDTAECLWLESGRRGDRTNHRPVVCPGRESTGASGPGYEGVRANGRLAESIQALSVAHQTGLRGQPASPSNGLSRCVSDAPCG